MYNFISINLDVWVKETHFKTAPKEVQKYLQGFLHLRKLTEVKMFPRTKQLMRQNPRKIRGAHSPPSMNSEEGQSPTGASATTVTR